MEGEEYLIKEKFIRQDDKKSFAELFKRYSKKVFQLALHYFHNEDDAEEIVQEVFIKIWIKRKSIQSPEAFSSFLYTTAKNMIFDSFRKEIKHKAYAEYLSKSSFHKQTENTEETIFYNDLEKIYTQLLEELPLKRKEVFTLSRQQGFSNQEIAEKMNISVKTVEEHIYQSLKFLKEIIKKRYELVILLLAFFQANLTS
ncbi:MAG: RNA polymerase sigma factor [Cyclobacteriaceae bacterium]